MDRPLPAAFVRRVRAQFPDGDALLEAIERGEPLAGLRVNPRKPAALPWAARPVPWEPWGHILPPGARPGLSPLHDAGAYYLQEPSAMAAVPLLRVEPGMTVLDACAAPGGKSGQIAAYLAGRGLLVSCEIERPRAAVLTQNLERLGIRNFMALCASPERVADALPGFFDRVLVDAPCSGEGMFRRHPETRAAWNEEAPAACARRQRLILDGACGAVKPGGLLAYSTCTFNREENEEVAEAFAQEHPKFTLLAAHRVLPHKDPGEGHFVAIFRRDDGPVPKAPQGIPSDETTREPWRDLCRALQLDPAWQEVSLLRHGDALYAPPPGTPALAGLPIVRLGVQLAAIRKGRLEPSHALASAILPGESARRAELDEEETAAYLAGHPLPCSLEKGWAIVSYQGLSLGWGKISDGTLKNHLPKGLRRGAPPHM